MKRYIIHIILILSMIIMDGCTRNAPPDRLEENPELSRDDKNNINININNNNNINHFVTPQAIGSRFISGRDSVPENAAPAVSGTNVDFEYYRPAEKIPSAMSIPPGKDMIPEEGPEYLATYNITTKKSKLQEFFREGRVAPGLWFTAVFDNDIFDYTDYYYTSGITFELFHPSVSASPFSRLLPGLRYSTNYYGITLVQNLYTPLKLENQDVLAGDRPFAAYLALGHQRISLSPPKHRRLQSEFTLGVIGPASLGGVSQDIIHGNEPVGWINQVENDIVINYNIRFEQGIYRAKDIEIAVTAGGQAGSLYDNITASLYLQLGRANDRYGSIFQTTGHQNKFSKRVRYYFALDLNNRLILYDATLQGGMFNRESIYKLESSQVSRYVFNGTASFGLGLGRYSLEAGQVFLTPEFEGGRHHFWFRIKNIFYIN
ncbi:MAG: lipid A deacylase LpxR family protein [Bacteroidales bacterium]|nr:lipid A deacylase LpxR family protein [Bacteroidales bacterium]